MKNDKLILQLQKQIDEKETRLKSAEKFAPITNCSLELDGTRINLNVANKEQLQLALVKLGMYEISANSLELTDFTIGGYAIEDWMSDIQNKLTILDKTSEKAKLKVMKDKLHNLLSHDKKVELELAEIMKSIEND